MWKNTIPKSLEKIINSPIVAEAYIDEQDFGETTGPFQLWIYFKYGWINTLTETHAIHEGTAKEILYQWKNYVKVCECTECAETGGQIIRDGLDSL